MKKSSKNEALREFDEKSARDFVLDQLCGHFEIIEQVQLKSQYGEPFRIDAMAVCQISGYHIGLEFKPSYLSMSEFADALRQAINYRDSNVIDIRCAMSEPQRMHCCALFPDWVGLHDDGINIYDREAAGMMVLAEKFRVGVLRRNHVPGALSLIMNKSGLWHSTSGWTGNAAGILLGKRRRGSGTKRHDS